MLKIGISSCLFYPDSARLTFSKKTLNYFENDMADYLTTNNALPILIPAFKTLSKLKLFCSQMDAFVFQGGSDICPESYNQKYLDKLKWPGDKRRDDYELEVMDYACQHKKPVLGICRGLQLINTYFGGTLHQDINSLMDTRIIHRDAIKYDSNYHDIEFDQNSLLNTKIYSNLSGGKVNSVHHQAVDKLGQGLIREAYGSDDDVLEAFRHESRDNFIYAVQWHPEFGHTLKHKVIESDRVYNYFLSQI
ncbi:MAG: putative glutamine amidotransferase [Francisellaceae bacterium]|jgi:putative glutamine amidotransferase